MSSAFLWPIVASEIARSTAAASYVLRVERGTAENLTLTLASTTRYYWASGDAQADADGGVGGVGDFLVMLAAALATHTSGAAWTLTLDSAFRLTIGCSATFRILAGDAATTLAMTALGLDQIDYVLATTSLTAARPMRGVFAPSRAKSSDSRPVRRRTIGLAESLTGRVRHAVHSEARARREVTFGLLAREQALMEYAPTTGPTSTAEHALEAAALGRPLRYYDDDATRSSSSYWLGRINEAYEDREKFIDRDPKHPSWRWRARFPLVEDTA